MIISVTLAMLRAVVGWSMRVLVTPSTLLTRSSKWTTLSWKVWNTNTKKYKYKYKHGLERHDLIFLFLKNYVGRVFSPFVRTLISKVVFLQIAPRRSWHANQPSNKTFLCCLISLTWKEITFSSFFLHLRILYSGKLWIFNVCINCC